jgi:hypothetical protein
MIAPAPIRMIVVSAIVSRSGPAGYGMLIRGVVPATLSALVVSVIKITVASIIKTIGLYVVGGSNGRPTGCEPSGACPNQHEKE